MSDAQLQLIGTAFIWAAVVPAIIVLALCLWLLVLEWSLVALKTKRNLLEYAMRRKEFKEYLASQKLLDERRRAMQQQEAK